MDYVTIGIWTAGIFAVAGIVVAFMIGKARKRPRDPEENLRLLLGPRGMALRERNQAASQRKRDAELLEWVNNPATWPPAKPDLPGAQKLEEETSTTRIQGHEHPDSTLGGRMPQYPVDDEVFTLTIEKPFTGLEMVRDYGFIEWQRWKFFGQEITEPQTKSFKLVSIGRCIDFDMVKRKLTEHGAIPQGQWCRALASAYPKAVRNGPIGVADASWGEPSPADHFPFILDDGDESFDHVVDMFDGAWRWLVEAR